MSARDRKLLEELIHDCVLYNLNENESLEYIRKRAVGIPISRSNFYSIKKRISGNESASVNERLTEHTRVGFVLEHFKHIKSIENVQKILFQTLINEHSRPSENKNLFAIAKIATCMFQNTNLLRLMNADTPFIRDMKNALDKSREYRYEAQTIRYNYVPTSRIIDPDSIAGRPQDSTPEERAANKPVF